MPMNVPTRPIYTPDYQIESGQYTEGKEWMDKETFEEYIGLYHQYPNKATYTNASYTNTSRQLIPYATQVQKADVLDDEGSKTGISGSLNNSVYYRLTGTRFDKHYRPPVFYSEPTAEQYESGYIRRFFLQKINDISNIIEVNSDEWDKRNTDNLAGVDEGIYRAVKLDWSVVGPVNDVRIANAKVIAEAEKTMPALSAYLSDLDEFHKNSHKIPRK